MTERKKSHQEEYAEKIAKELIERLKQGTAPFQLPWQPDMGRDFPFNPVSGTEYSGMNRLNLMIQGYSDPRWMTYKQAQSVNAQVRKKAKSKLQWYAGHTQPFGLHFTQR